MNKLIKKMLCQELCVDLTTPDKDLEQALSRRVYKGTNCGAWLSITGINSIKVGSIVEGCDFGAESIELVWTFTKKEFWGALEDIEKECEYIWQQTHGCEDCNCEGEWGHKAINPDCKTCEGEGTIL